MNKNDFLEFNKDFNYLANKRGKLLETLDLLTKEFEEYSIDYNNFQKYMINEKGESNDDLINRLSLLYNNRLLFFLLKDKKENKDGIESLYEHIKGIYIHDEYNDLVKLLESNRNLLINARIGDGDICDSKNDLFLSDCYSHYLISNKLEESLLGENKLSDKSFYVVVFNTITKGGSKVLIYNYMEYNIYFIELFYAYLLLEYKLSRSSIYKGHNNICLVDKDLYSRYGLDNFKVCKDLGGNRLKINFINFLQDGIKDDKGILLEDLDKMGEFVFNLMNKNNVSLMKYIYGKDADIKKLRESFYTEYKSVEINNLLPKFIFVVSDKNSFIEKIKKNYIKDVNQGPQKYRGKVNSLSHSLFLLNKKFIDSIWLHHQVYLKNTNKYIRYIPDSAFSFNNINMKLGNIRWYSVGRNINKDIILRRRGKLYPVGAPQLICRELGVKEINPILFCKQCVVRYSIKSINQRRNTVWHSHQEIKNIIYNNPINEETQTKIEKYNLDKYTLKYGEGDIYSNNIGYKLSDEGRNFYIDCRKSLCTLINNFKARELDKNQNKNIQAKHIFECKKILDKLEVDFVVNLQLWFILKILNLFKEEDKSATKIYLEIGKAFINKYYYVLYKEKKDMVDNINYKMNDWRAENIDLINKYDDTALHGLGSIILNWIVEIGLLQIEVVSNPISGYKKLSIITATKKLNSFRINNFVILPNKLPMIVKPNEFEMDTNGKFKKLGGFLLNNEDYVNDLIIHNWRSKEKTKINKINSIISVVNNISSVGYKINKDVLSFIRLNDKRLNLTLVNKEHPLEDKIKGGDKLTKLEKTQLESYNSKKFVEENIIGLADIFENINEFFIPVRIDFRGRMYCDVDYLNYQGTELAKSLLLFSKGEKIFKTDVSSINYIKIHGANSYGNGVDKKSFEDRVRWVDENTERIRNFDVTLIKNAASKLMFIAFCYEYNKMLDCVDISDNEYFVTHLPIQLDASCNGYQHISMLVKDIDMAKNLNLVKSNKSDAPQDFYGHISNYLNTYFMGEGEEILKKDKSLKESLVRLKELNINRGLIKKAIMTIPYNATSLKLIEYIKEPFEYDKEYTEYRLKERMGENLNEKKEIWYRLKTNKDIKLQEKDFLAWYYIQKFILEKLFPSLTHISTYFKEVATVCTKLGLAIPWKLPTGLVAYQSYLKVKEIRVKPLNFSKNTFNLKVLVRDEYDKIKQIRGLMPNLIHSLDSTSMTLLMDKYFKSIDNEYKNIYAIHDCFAVTANNMENLIHLLKIVYISLYSDEGYLEKFDAYVRIHIKNHYGDVFSKDGLEINVSNLDPIKYPDLKKVLKNTYNIKMLLDSSYLIH